jgi:hypothetical protein
MPSTRASLPFLLQRLLQRAHIAPRPHQHIARRSRAVRASHHPALAPLSRGSKFHAPTRHRVLSDRVETPRPPQRRDFVCDDSASRGWNLPALLLVLRTRRGRRATHVGRRCVQLVTERPRVAPSEMFCIKDLLAGRSVLPWPRGLE